MRELERVSQDLNRLQAQLQATVNRLWKLKFSLNSALYHGYSEQDFLPRRLTTLRREEQARLDLLLSRLRHLLAAKLSKPSYRYESETDRETLAEIHRTMRYLKNAYCADPTLLHALARIGNALPARASH